MQLLNVSFIILVIKITFCVLPGVIGIVLIASSEETKRNMRNRLCATLFDVSNAIELQKFVRVLHILAAVLILFSLAASWFFLLRGFI